MNKNTVFYSFALLVALVAAPVQAADFDAPAFVGKNCTACHDSSVYTRSTRRVKNLGQLDAQVRRCDSNLGIQLFDDDIQAIVGHLNDNYYHFGK